MKILTFNATRSIAAGCLNGDVWYDFRQMGWEDARSFVSALIHAHNARAAK